MKYTRIDRRMGHGGHISLDEIVYFSQFPHHPHPYDVRHAMNDKDSVPFAVINGTDAETILLGNRQPYGEFLAANAITEASVVIKGRAWLQSGVMVLDMAKIDTATAINVAELIKHATGVDIDSWHIFSTHENSNHSVILTKTR